MLVIPTCSMRAQGAPDRYAHPVRSLVPLRPFEELVGAGLLDDSKAGLARKRDGLINYLYLRASEEFGLPETLALLYMPVTLHHEFLEANGSPQLAVEGACQLQSKLVCFREQPEARPGDVRASARLNGLPSTISRRFTRAGQRGEGNP